MITVSAFLMLSCTGKREGVLPRQTRLTESVYASATVQPDSLYQVYASVGGILERNLVEEGDLVQKGTPLLQIVNHAPKLNAENAKLALQLARENYNGSSAVLKGLEDEIAAARLTFRNDSVNFYRQKRLWEQKIGSKVEFDNRQLAYELSRNNLNLLKSRYERTKNELWTQVEQARNNYESSLINTKDFMVASTIKGRVYALFKEAGEIVSTMEPLASVGSDSVFIVEMLVDEVDIVKVALGQKVLITLDAYPSKVFTAKVSKIYPEKTNARRPLPLRLLLTRPRRPSIPVWPGRRTLSSPKRRRPLPYPRTI